MDTITREQAEAALAAVKAQFSAYLQDDTDEAPVLCEPGTQADHWSIAWESGPDEWALRAFSGGFDEEMYALARDAGASTDQAQALAHTATTALPPGVWTEPYYTWLLVLCPADDEQA